MHQLDATFRSRLTRPCAARKSFLLHYVRLRAPTASTSMKRFFVYAVMYVGSHAAVRVTEI